MLNRLFFSKQEWPLTFNDTRDLSKGCRRTGSLECVRPKEFFKFHSFEIAARNDSQDPSILGHRNMTESAFTHHTQCIDGAAPGCNRHGIARHRFRQMGATGFLAFGE